MARRARSMFMRVLFYGILMLVVAALGLAGLTGVAVRSMESDTQRLVSWLGTHACRVQATTGLSDFPIPATVYDQDGKVLSTSIQPPLQEVAHFAFPPFAGSIKVVRCTQDQRATYVLLQRPHSSFGLVYMALAFGGVLLMVVLASIPLARSITAPIAQIASSTRQFGNGELTSRVEVNTEDELGDLSRAFNQMADRITVLLRQEKELLANVSHELRTPLARMRVVLEDAQEAPGRTPVALAEISRDLAELERLVDDVLDAVRLEKPGSTEFVLRVEAVSVGELFEAAVARFKRTSPRRALVSHAPASLQVESDSALLLRVIDNVLENARRYSDETSVIQLRAATSSTGVTIEVEDQGIGIEPGDLPRVFTPFFRGDRSRTRATGGVGLGLSICQRIVTAHGGRIDVKSTVDVGTTVVIALPQVGKK
jgi:signal transduction histidine kinase